MAPAPAEPVAGSDQRRSVVGAWVLMCMLAGAGFGVAPLLLLLVISGQSGFVIFAVIALVLAAAAGTAVGLVTGLLNGIVARALPQASWFVSAEPRVQRRLAAVLAAAVTAGAVLATRPLWIWLTITPFNLSNPVSVNGDPGVVDGFVGVGALVAALAVALLSRCLPPVRGTAAPLASWRTRAAVSAAAAVIAAGAVVSLAVTAIVVPADITRPTFFWDPAVAGTSRVAGPIFAVALSGSDNGPAAVYRASGYGPQVRPVAVIQPPPGESFDRVTALGDDRTFVFTTVVPSDAPVYRTYEIRLGDDGQPGPLTQVRLPAADELAFSPDGSKVAAAVEGRRSTEITVLTLATGTSRTWSAPGLAANLSWADDRDIAFMWSPRMTSAWDPVASLRLLDTRTPGSQLHSRLLLPASVRAGQFQRLSSSSPALVAGNAIFAVMTSPRSAPSGHRTAVVEFSARTGQPERVLNQDRQNDLHAYCGIVWADASAQHVLTSCGSTVSRADGATITSWQGSAWNSLSEFIA